MKAKHLFSVIWVVVLALTSSCSKSTEEAVQVQRLNIIVSILPQSYLVERVGGEHVEVTAIVDKGSDPHTFEPKPEQMKVISGADAYYTIGVEFEAAWMDRLRSANESMAILDMAAGVEPLPGEANGAGDIHGEENDPHIWLSPELVKFQVEIVYDGLVQLDPTNRQEYQSNRDQLLADIEQLQKDIHAELDGVENRKFLVFHPSWGYFAAEFGLEQISVEVGGVEPSGKEMVDIIKLAKDQGIKVIFASPQFSTRSAEVIANEIGGKVVLIDPLAEDWLENLRTVGAAFSAVLGIHE